MMESIGVLHEYKHTKSKPTLYFLYIFYYIDFKYFGQNLLFLPHPVFGNEEEIKLKKVQWVSRSVGSVGQLAQ